MTTRLDKLDLKMLRVLLTLARTRNTYRAAEQLHLSQSAVSRALGRLREALDDPLFIRSAHGLEPTAFTDRVVARLPEVFELLSETMAEDADFQPLDWHGDVSLALSSHVCHCWGTQLYEALSIAAPNVVWNFQTWSHNSTADIQEGKIALGIHFQNPHWPQAMYQQTLAEDEFALMVRDQHPALGQIPTAQLFETYSLVSLLLPDWNDYANLLEASITGLGITPTVSLRTDNMRMALNSLRQTDKIMAGTRALAASQEGLTTLPYPADIVLPEAKLVMCYSQRQRRSSRYQWLSKQLINVVASV